MDISEFYATDFTNMLSVAYNEDVRLSEQFSCKPSVRLTIDGSRRDVSVLLTTPEAIRLFLDQLPVILPNLCKLIVRQGVTPRKLVEVYVYTTFDFDPDTSIDETVHNLAKQDIQIVWRTPTYAVRRNQLTQLIDSFLVKYDESERALFDAITQNVREQIETLLKANDVLSWISSRTKDTTSLKDKLWQRALPLEKGKNYLTEEDIFTDIADLSGVRVSLYFPGDRDKAITLISQITNPYEIRSYPEDTVSITFQKRFSGYWAKHMRTLVSGKVAGLSDNRNFRCEIQIASVVMHAWAEVNHDLVYKQHDGALSPHEIELLDAMNGLAITGEIVLEQLQSARIARKQSYEQMIQKHKVPS